MKKNAEETIMTMQQYELELLSVYIALISIETGVKLFKQIIDDKKEN